MGNTSWRWDIDFAESGEQRYARALQDAGRRKDGGFDRRYNDSKFIEAYEAGDPKAVHHGVIRGCRS